MGGTGSTDGFSNFMQSAGRPFVRRCRDAWRISVERLSSPSVTSYLMGGCANQLFQYATGLALARRFGARLQLDVSYYETQKTHRSYALGLFSGVKAPLVRESTGEIIYEQGYPYNPALFESPSRRFSIRGYWQCEKYFEGLRTELSNQLRVRQPLPTFHADIERQIAEAAGRSVFLHIRRTDYVGNPFHVVLPMDYYVRASALIVQKIADPVFFVFSDDEQWCRENFRLPWRTVIADSPDMSLAGREDAVLWLMRRCSHAIIANSSFSWWGAWLGADARGGIVVAPTAWFGPAWAEDPRDIVPGRWLKM